MPLVAGKDIEEWENPPDQYMTKRLVPLKEFCFFLIMGPFIQHQT